MCDVVSIEGKAMTAFYNTTKISETVHLTVSLDYPLDAVSSISNSIKKIN